MYCTYERQMSTSVIYWSTSSFAMFCYALSLSFSLFLCVYVCARACVKRGGGARGEIRPRIFDPDI